MAGTRVRRRVGVVELNSHSPRSHHHHRCRRRLRRRSRHRRRLHQRRRRFYYLSSRVCLEINEISRPIRIKYSATYLYM